jgi:hypothetical protein
LGIFDSLMLERQAATRQQTAQLLRKDAKSQRPGEIFAL